MVLLYGVNSVFNTAQLLAFCNALVILCWEECNNKCLLNVKIFSYSQRYESLRVGGRESKRLLAQNNGVIAEMTSGVRSHRQLAQTLANQITHTDLQPTH